MDASVLRVVSVVYAGVGVDCAGVELAFDIFVQVPSLLGRQFTQCLPAFTQAQPLHKPTLLHLQHAISTRHLNL